jgi:hypothetical protein
MDALVELVVADVLRELENRRLVAEHGGLDDETRMTRRDNPKVPARSAQELRGVSDSV